MVAVHLGYAPAEIPPLVCKRLKRRDGFGLSFKLITVAVDKDN
ncbi:hypothetical protein SDC9_92447 [bioreactor metagenome]|uniref:Uncharacterized protein n=1 Tax=bioreactor metagenome TaxID=1076179 RepID=A0A644ZXU4_9ZZZZ